MSTTDTIDTDTINTTDTIDTMGIRGGEQRELEGIGIVLNMPSLFSLKQANIQAGRLGPSLEN